MQTRQEHQAATDAWNNGIILQWNTQLLANWSLQIPDELFLTADEIEEARPWQGIHMSLEEQMAHLAFDPRQ